MWDHFLSRHWSQLSPDFPLQEFTCYAREQVMTILPDSPPRFINLNNYFMVRAVVGALSRYGFHPERVKRHGKPSPTSDALRDSWHDLDAHYDALGNPLLAVLSADDGAGVTQGVIRR